MGVRTTIQAVQFIEAIRVAQPTGTGKADDPFRVEVSYWSTSGQLLARMDINDDPCWQFSLKLRTSTTDQHKEGTP